MDITVDNGNTMFGGGLLKDLGKQLELVSNPASGGCTQTQSGSKIPV